MRRASLLAPLAVVLLGAFGCTFPSVDYADEAGVADAGPGDAAPDAAACAAPANCATAAMKCEGDADKKYMTCVMGCHADPSCMMACDVDETTAALLCVKKCAMCAAPTCGDAGTDCASFSMP